MTNYNDGEWHGWNGGKCPVHPKTVVQIMMRCEIGEEWNDESNKARAYRWNHYGCTGDIIAFRVVKEHKEPREWWIDRNGMAHSDECFAGSGAVHVREVIE